MQIELLHYELERRWNMNSNAHRKQMTDLEKDQVLNTAIFNYVEMFYSGTNPKGYQVGFEVNQQRIDMLDTLVFGYPEEPLLRPTKLDATTYQFDLSQLSRAYRSYISGEIETDCGLLQVRPEQHGDMAKIRKDYHRAASLKWKEVPAVQRGDKLIIILPSNVKIVKGLRLSYLKRPSQVCLGTYTDIPTKTNPNPRVKAKVECDIPEDYHELILMIAVQELHRIYNNIEQVQSLSEQINSLT